MPVDLLIVMNQNTAKNEPEFLGVVWSLEHNKYYLYGCQFDLQREHQALLLALKKNRRNKTYQGPLTRWVDRLLPFTFTVILIPGQNMGFANFFSRYPISAASAISENDTIFSLTLQMLSRKHSKTHTEFQPIRTQKNPVSTMTS